MKEYNKMNGFAEELCSRVFNTERLQRICENYNIEFDELNDIY